jgi:hypothetical protein
MRRPRPAERHRASWVRYLTQSPSALLQRWDCWRDRSAPGFFVAGRRTGIQSAMSSDQLKHSTFVNRNNARSRLFHDERCGCSSFFR